MIKNYKFEHLKETCLTLFTGIYILEEKLDVLKYGHDIPYYKVSKMVQSEYSTYNFRRSLRLIADRIKDFNDGINIRFGHLYESDEEKYFKAFDLALELHKTKTEQLRAKVILERKAPRKFLAKIQGNGMSRSKPNFQKMRRKVTKERTKKLTLRRT